MPRGPMKNVFVACTQHHICLALAIIEQESLLDSVILFFCAKSVLKANSFFSAVEKSQQNKNFKIIFVHPDLQTWIPNPFKRILVNRMVYKNMKAEIGPFDGKYKFYIFNDARQESQYVISHYKRSHFYFVQDGIAQYIYHTLKVRKWFKLLYYKILFGFFWRSIEQHGDYYPYEAMYLQLPDCIYPRYKMPARGISATAFYNANWKKISREVIEIEFPEFFQFQKESLIVFLPFFFTQDLMDQGQKELEKLFKQDEAKNIFIKNHPRSPYKLSFSDPEINVRNIPEGVPAECFFAFSQDIKCKYYIVPSTLLVIAASIVPKEQSRVIFKELYGFVNGRVKQNEKFKKVLKEKLDY